MGFASIRTLPLSVAILSGALAIAQSVPSPASKSPAPATDQRGDVRTTFFKDLAETGQYTFGKPTKLQLTPDGSSVLFLRSGPRDRRLTLFELSVGTGQVQEVLNPETILKGGDEKLSVEEKARRERMREYRQGFTSFQLSNDGSKILVSLSGKTYVVARATKRVTELPGTNWIDARFSPNGQSVAGVQLGELHVVDLASLRDVPVTSGATETLTHGLAEFVAQEEMDRFSGYWWAADSGQLVFEEADLSGVEKFYIADPADPGQAPNAFSYPRPGKPNAKVRLGIVGASGGATTWIQWDSERYPYLARVHWPDSAPLTLLVLTRNQKEAKLLTVDTATGSTRDVLTETDSAWINLERTGRIPEWMPDGSSFLWMTERRGDTQLELRGRTGAFIRALTPVGFHFKALLDVNDKEGTLCVSGGPDPRETHLYRVPLNGGDPVRISQGPGIHSAVHAKDHRTYVHHAWLLDGQESSGVRNADGKLLAVLPSVAENPPFSPRLELVRVGRERVFDALVIRPRDFQPGRKYPVILDVYAGPGIKVVQGTPRYYLNSQWMADQGYIVAMIDGRGTPGHGRDWERAILGNLIDVPLEDQVAGLKALGERFPEMDLTRTGITGGSFGGYFTAMATLRRPEVFRCGVAISSVADWMDYDSCYTERYLDLPSANPEGYRRSSVLTYANKLERPLLIVHGLTDDNVYFAHSFRLMEALFRAGRPFEFLPLPGTHMAGAEDSVLAMRENERVMEFFDRHLNPLPGK